MKNNRNSYILRNEQGNIKAYIKGGSDHLGYVLFIYDKEDNLIVTLNIVTSAPNSPIFGKDFPMITVFDKNCEELLNVYFEPNPNTEYYISFYDPENPGHNIGTISQIHDIFFSDFD